MQQVPCEKPHTLDTTIKLQPPAICAAQRYRYLKQFHHFDYCLLIQFSVRFDTDVSFSGITSVLIGLVMKVCVTFHQRSRLKSSQVNLYVY